MIIFSQILCDRLNGKEDFCEFGIHGYLFFQYLKISGDGSKGTCKRHVPHPPHCNFQKLYNFLVTIWSNVILAALPLRSLRPH